MFLLSLLAIEYFFIVSLRTGYHALLIHPSSILNKESGKLRIQWTRQEKSSPKKSFKSISWINFRELIICTLSLRYLNLAPCKFNQPLGEQKALVSALAAIFKLVAGKKAQIYSGKIFGPLFWWLSYILPSRWYNETNVIQRKSQ